MKLKSLILLLTVFFAKNAQACTVCFGADGGNWNKGFYWGILLLLLLPVFLVGFIAFKIYSSMRRKSLKN